MRLAPGKLARAAYERLASTPPSHPNNLAVGTTILDSRITERRNPRSAEIDLASPLEIVDLINREDAGIADAVHAERLSIARAVSLAEATFREGGRLLYLGAGTSGRLGVLDASECPPTFGTDPEMVQGIIAGGPPALLQAQEGAEDRAEDGAEQIDARDVGPRDFVIGIAASGTTPWVHAGVRRAKERGARTGLVSCTPPPAAALESADVATVPIVGPQVVTAANLIEAGTDKEDVPNTITA